MTGMVWLLNLTAGEWAFLDVKPAKHTSKPDISLKMSGESWAKLYLSQATPEEMIASGDITVTGDAKEAARLINLFDRYSPEKAVVIPPTTLVQDHP